MREVTRFYALWRSAPPSTRRAKEIRHVLLSSTQLQSPFRYGLHSERKSQLPHSPTPCAQPAVTFGATMTHHHMSHNTVAARVALSLARLPPKISPAFRVYIGIP